MKKYWIIVISLIIFVLSIFTFLRFKGLSIDDAISLGENKFLEFTWITYGAFNDDENITINGKRLNDSHKIITCEAINGKCFVRDFEQVYHRLFSKKVEMKKVYGDKFSFNWYEVIDNQYYFNYPKNCSIHSVIKDFSLKLVSNTFNKIVYEIEYLDEGISHDQEKRKAVKQFILVKEDNDWKIAEAFYRDVCMMSYNIS